MFHYNVFLFLIIYELICKYIEFLIISLLESISNKCKQTVINMLHYSNISVTVLKSVSWTFAHEKLKSINLNEQV